MVTGSCYHDDSGYARAVARNYLKRLEFPMPEESPLVRQWILLRTLCAKHHGATVKEMTEEMAVSDKTIRRETGPVSGRERQAPVVMLVVLPVEELAAELQAVVDAGESEDRPCMVHSRVAIGQIAGPDLIDSSGPSARLAVS